MRVQIPENHLNSVPKIPDLEISLNGIQKLLKILKPGKAAGPDKIKPILLEELREKITPIVKVSFERSLQIGKLPADWVKCKCYARLQKRRKKICSQLPPHFPHRLSL